MRYVRYICIAVFAIALVAISLANRQVVTVKVLPDEIAVLFAMNPAIELPLFMVIFGGIIAGLAIGFLWEWVREYNIRAQAQHSKREVRRLERQVKRLKTKNREEDDDVLALLDDAT